VGVIRAIRERSPAGTAAGDFLHRADPAELRRWAGVEDGA
jgi:hypothetical protein